jgi:methylenetetrahydrofolate reductase (NADPH)
VSALQELLESRRRPVITAELPSVDGGGLDAVKRRLELLAPYCDAVNATDNPAAHAHASNVSIAIAVKQLGTEPILQVVCRDKNRLAIQADIIGASLFGVENVCALTGDDVTAGDEPEARRVFDLDGPQLIRVAAGLAEGHYLSGRVIDPAPRLFVGAVENPYAPPLEHRIDRAAKKSANGARFLQLQIGYRPDRLEQFVAGCVASGTATRTALIPTVCLTKSARALTFMDEHVPGISIPPQIIQRVKDATDQAEESFQVTLELARHALSLPGVAGLHIGDFRHDGTFGRLVEELGIDRSDAATSTTAA